MTKSNDKRQYKHIWVDESVPDNVVEAYETLLESISFSLEAKGYDTIIVTGGKEDTGASTVAANLAAIIGKKKGKSLIVDADMRKSSQHKFFGVENEQGLSELICRRVTLDDVVKKTNVNGLDIITSGALPPNPIDLLEADNIDEVFDEMRRKYDMVIIDTPALTEEWPDALALMKKNTGVVLVAQQEKTTIEALKKIQLMVDERDAGLLGVVLKNSPKKKRHIFKFY